VALCDDLNTPGAIAEVHALAKQLHKAEAADKPALKARILAAGKILGILESDPQSWLQGGISEGSLTAQEIESLIAQRSDAKQNKDYARADDIRQALTDAGIVLEDSPEGTQWRRER